MIADDYNSEELDRFFKTKSIAVFGASTNPQKSGYRIVKNLLDHNYSGEIYPINPKGGEILGLPVYKSLVDVSSSVDLAIVFVPNKIVVPVLQQCIDKGIKAAIVEAAGFSEVGSEGKGLRDEIVRITDNFHKIRVLGPNCTGITYVERDGEGCFSSFIPMANTKAGPLAIVSQSGFINGAYYPDFTERNPNLGIRYVITIGNKMDIDENDVLEYLLHDPKVQVIGMYLESFKDVRRFIRLCRRAKEEFHKKVILLRSGFSRTGSKATTSHTGALAENGALIQAAIKQSHLIHAEDFWELFQLSKVLTFLYETGVKDISIPKIAISTISGAAGAVMSDWGEKFGLEVPEFTPDSWNKLVPLYPPWMPPNKFALIDYWPAVEHARGDYQKVVLESADIALADPNIQVLFLTVYYNAHEWTVDWARLGEIIKKHKKPIFVFLFGKYNEVLEAEHIFQEVQIPIFYSESELVRIFAKILHS